MSMVERQNEDGTWSPAEPVKVPWTIRLELAIRRWWRSR